MGLGGLIAASGRAEPSASDSSDAPHELRAGFGVAPLPARIGAPLGGYGGLFDRRAAGVHDPPQARSLVVERGPLRIALIALDVVIPRAELHRALESRAAALGIDSLTIAATHTHSGPGGYIEGFLAERITAGHFDASLQDALIQSAFGALEAAAADLRPVGVRVGESTLALAANRRVADGPRESSLPLLALEPDDGSARIVVIAYGAHPTLFSPSNRLFSADYVGAARAALETAGLRPIFFAGPMGDQRVALESEAAAGRSLAGASEAERVQRAGERLASGVVDALAQLAPSTGDLELESAELALPPFELRRFCALWWLSPLVRGPARRLLSERVPMQLLRIGTARLLMVPAEPGTELGDAFRKVIADRFPDDVRFVIAHANDWAGYVVTEETYARGGYEACLSFRGPRFGPWLVERAAELSQQAQQHTQDR